ncbi:MAG: hypothetical protein ACTSRU_03180 [Candidatus Hodarchaeales archaeon]
MLIVLPTLSYMNPVITDSVTPISNPTAQWSVTDGDTLIGPNAPLSVSWVGGEKMVVNNTLEFLAGERILKSQGIFDSIITDNHVLQFTVSTPGFYSMILSWNDSITDLDVTVYDDITFVAENSVLNPWWQMSTLAFPERVDGVYLDSGDYWANIDWYSGNVPVEYTFFVGTDDYFYRNFSTSGVNITVDTETVPDATYTVIASCFDSDNNLYTDNITITTRNQYPPVIEWIRYNSYTENGTIIHRGEKLVFQWYATDINNNDDIFSTMFYKKPGDYSFSLLFSSWMSFTYTVYWNNTYFDQDGLYRFRLEVNNFNQPPSEAVFFNFYIINSSNIETGTSLESSTSTNPLLNSTNGFSIIIIIITLPVALIINKKRK